jgi:hypothetical protein
VKADALKMSLDSAFWVWNLVGSFAYGERAHEAYPLIKAEIDKFQTSLVQQTAHMDDAATAVSNSSIARAVQMVTEFGCKTGDQMTKDWLAFWMSLFVRFRDGLTVTQSATRQCDPDLAKHDVHGCTSRASADAKELGYSDEWYSRIVKENGEHYHVPGMTAASAQDQEALSWKLLRMEKQRR